MDVSRTYRILQLITMLQSGRGYTATELASELGVTRRTVFRDLNMLELAKIPYYFDEELKCYRIRQHFFLPPVNLTLPEALSILVLAGKANSQSRLPLLAESARAAVKLESALPEAIRRHVGGVLERMTFSLGPLSSHEGLDETFNQLTSAILNKRICRIAYISFQEKKQLLGDVHPLRLVFRSRAWYVIAYSVRHRELRTFKLGRIRKLTVTDRTFAVSPQIDVEKHFDGAWGMIPEGKHYDIHLHFDPKVAGNVAEVRWHPTQRVEWNDDGSMEYRAKVNGLGEITWWILGYGDQVEVASPPELRRRLAELAQSMARRYSASKEAN